ncbi:GNAT family N-acetyltransferase [Dactylosporangium sp. AC04546]|uniref:GNAT family N-acetyltransferase n=1 Tax=Dactylosporangium sp. AC04546 TaxID=2862460 RepID=UPI001EDD4A7B|nr:GNAT family N-acetyltransferase [Dactylosporangium sp. AC04546]WVK82785.1 GNAT family N-acetyltransferase [Dactylosporangium sp. AC04546]
MLIEQRPSGDSEVIALVVDQQVELRTRDGGRDGHVYSVDPAARYLVAVVGGDAVACGAILAVDIDTAEVTRLYVRPAYRGRGLARRMLAALEDFAASRGHRVLRLETGVTSPDAISLFLAAGYRPIPRFGPYVKLEASRCFEKRFDDGNREVRVIRRAVADGEVAELMAAAENEAAGRYGEAGRRRFPLGPNARFVLATVDGVPAGCGALQPLDDQTAEIKRMYVRPAHRGNGIARRVLAALEDLATGSHYRVVRLETGPRQPEAIRLYESAGYRPIPPYGPYVHSPLSLCYEKLVIAPEPIASELA